LKKLTIILGAIIVLLLATSMFLYANPNIFEFLVALFLKAMILVKVKLPLLIFGLLVSLKKFIFGLTFFKVMFLGIKRYFIDHVISNNLQNYFFFHIKAPMKKWWKSFDARKKLFFFIPASLLSALGLYFAEMGKILNFLGIKTLVISFFKGLWVVGGKVFYFFTYYIWTTWFAPILEVLIFSWLLTLAEKVPVLKDIVKKMYDFITTIFSRTSRFLDKHINSPVRGKLNKSGKKIGLYIRQKNRLAQKEVKVAQETLEDSQTEEIKTNQSEQVDDLPKEK
jgi:hypothetical protein